MSKKKSDTHLIWHWVAVTSSIILALSIAGCSVPGYSSHGITGSPWYDFTSNPGQASYSQHLADREIDYEPVVVKITPRLIRHQKRERSNHVLPAAERRVTTASSGKEQAYKIGAGDILNVVVFGHSNLSAPSASAGGAVAQGGKEELGNGVSEGELVNAKGNIYFPYIGQVQAAGLTLSHMRQKLARKLSQYIRKPQVDVRVKQYRSQQVYIGGDIAQPCTVPITDITLTVMEALSQCQSVASSQGSSGSGRSTKGLGVGVQNVVLVRDGRSTTLDLNRINASGRSVPLQAGDHLLIDDSQNRVFMVGEFNKQLALPYSTGGMSLADAMADAGGVKLDTANTESIYVIRGFVAANPAGREKLTSVIRPKVYKLNANSATGLILANEFRLQPRDVVFAAPASLVNFNRALKQVTPTVNLLFRSFLIYDRASN